jgi:hypothetical protein
MAFSQLSYTANDCVAPKETEGTPRKTFTWTVSAWEKENIGIQLQVLQLYGLPSLQLFAILAVHFHRVRLPLEGKVHESKSGRGIAGSTHDLNRD